MKCILVVSYESIYVNTYYVLLLNETYRLEYNDLSDLEAREALGDSIKKMHSLQTLE